MPDESLAARLDLLDQHIRDLRDVQPPNFAAYESDKILRRYTERMLHMAIDTCSQIGIALLTQEGLRRPENYHDVFIVLGENGILPQDTVGCMTAMVEFRNVLVYEHSTIDDTMVYGFAKKRLGDFSDFSNAVRGYLSKPTSAAFPPTISTTQ
jgi:uncharacterized protein YutE (UPF0331/DUF86 family)